MTKRIVTFLGIFLFVGIAAQAEEICGVIPATLVIFENSELTCDVVCGSTTGPCIQFGKDNIKLRLNGFKMTGPANPAAGPASGCAPSPAFGPGNPGPFPHDGISTAGFDHVEILGPGMVQMFRRHGIFVFESEKSDVKQVTSHFNCYSGIFLGFSNDNDIEENVSVRNGSFSGVFPCGGNCITNSNRNRIRRNEFWGNGSVAPGGVGPGVPPGTPPPAPVPNDFGVGFVGTSSGNVVEENGIGGKINGV